MHVHAAEDTDRPQPLVGVHHSIQIKHGQHFDDGDRAKAKPHQTPSHQVHPQTDEKLDARCGLRGWGNTPDWLALFKSLLDQSQKLRVPVLRLPVEKRYQFPATACSSSSRNS